MKNNKYTVDYFIDKFSTIPDNQFTLGEYVSKNGTKCALGHCGFTNNDDTAVEGRQLNNLMTRAFGIGAANISDGAKNIYYFNPSRSYNAKELGSTPKKRILTALELIKAGVSI